MNTVPSTDQSPKECTDAPDMSFFDIRLSKKEVEVLKLICDEWTSKDIAAILNISERTVETHRLHLREKIKAKSIVGLVKYAIKSGLYPLDDPADTETLSTS